MIKFIVVFHHTFKILKKEIMGLVPTHVYLKINVAACFVMVVVEV